jgi:4-aminobutyrate aminotransferase-like enzyme
MASKNLDLWNQYGDRLIPIMPFMDNVIVSAQGSYMIDADGNRILDLAAGQFCNILGHTHPEFTDRVKAALDKCLHTGSQFVTDSVLETAEKIRHITPNNLDNVVLLSTGTEANELALRIAKTVTNRSGAIGYDRGYYGISLATRSLSSISEGHIDFSPRTPETHHLIAPNCGHCPLRLEYPDCGIACLDLSTRLIGESLDNVAAIIVETIISAGGMIYPSGEYMQALRKLADSCGALLIVDEAQTGFGRCGTWFDCENLGIEPDILVFSKTSGNGYPSSGVLISDDLKQRLIERGFYHLSSHQNDPITATAISAVIDIIRDNDYLQMCTTNGQYFLDGLNRLRDKHNSIDNIRGRGLMIAFDIVKDDAKREPYLEMLTPFVLACKEKGVHITYTYYEGSIRLIPAINIEKSDIDFALEVIDNVLDDLEQGRIDAQQVAQKNKVIRESEKPRRVKRVMNRLWETSPEYWLKRVRRNR